MKKLIAIFSIALVLFSCGSDAVSEESTSGKDNFNRKEMLTFWADKIIIPGYEDFASKTESLNSSIEKFTTSQTEENLKQAREAFKKAYISWQKVSLFQIGKAQSVNLAGSVNTYPTNTKRLLEFTELGTYNLESSNLNSVQGLPALDYLLYGVGKSDAEVVEFFKKNRKVATYLKDVTNHLNKLAINVKNDWKGSYRNTFIEKDGNSETSSVVKVVNYYVIPFYEKQLRENKIVTPAGIRSTKGNIYPEKVEAYYCGDISKELYTTALQATINFFNGTAYDGTTKGQSLQQYLEFLKKENLLKEKKLVEEINTSFKNLSKLSSGLENNFANQVKDEEKRKAMLSVYDALQVVLKRFKSDMMSAMGVSNTSTDSDND